MKKGWSIDTGSEFSLEESEEQPTGNLYPVMVSGSVMNQLSKVAAANGVTVAVLLAEAIETILKKYDSRR